MKKLFCVMIFGLLLTSHAGAQTLTDREGEGLKGLVKSMRVERTEIVKRDGETTESPRMLLWAFTYDEQGNRTEELQYDRYGALEEKTVLVHEGEGTLIRTVYQADGTMKGKWIGTYKAGGKMTGSASYDAHGVLQMKSGYTYDADGKLTEAAVYNADGSLMTKTIFKHDAQGKQLGLEVYNSAGVLMQKQMQTNSDNTNTIYQPDGSVAYKFVNQPSSCELDSHGNWIKKSTPRTVTRGDKTEEVIEVMYRTINYY